MKRSGYINGAIGLYKLLQEETKNMPNQKQIQDAMKECFTRLVVSSMNLPSHYSDEIISDAKKMIDAVE